MLTVLPKAALPHPGSQHVRSQFIADFSIGNNFRQSLRAGTLVDQTELVEVVAELVGGSGCRGG